MSLQPIKTALKYVGAWSMVAAFLALLTIIFSFLGALFCAALGGMMMGATKASLRLSVFYSVLCPGVLFAVMRSQKTELEDRQIIVLVVICLAAFWSIYLVSAALMAQEQKHGSPNGKPTPALEAELRVTGAGQGAESKTAPPLDGAVNGAAVPPGLQLAALEGYWCCEACGHDGRSQKRILEIKDGAVALSTLDAQGNVCTCARGRLRWMDLPETRALVVSAEADEEGFPSPAI